MSVELIYDLGCPYVRQARRALVEALVAADREARWTEWDRSDPRSPRHAIGYGSPTILVNGLDVAGERSDGASACCRLYWDGAGRFNGAPTVEQIAAALHSSRCPWPAAPQRSSGWKTSLAMMPGAVFVLLPKLTCPASWPAYAGVLGSLGLGFLMDVRYLLPLTFMFLFVAVTVLAIGARVRRGYGPVVLGLVASAAVLWGKFVLESNAATFGGIALLVGASLWNAWPIREKAVPCRACDS